MALSVDDEQPSSTNGEKSSEAVGTYVRVSVCANQGGRKYMEDRVHIECVRLPDTTVDYIYVAVYDGHGGAEASEFVRKNLLRNIQVQSGFDGDDDQMLAAIRSGFVETHNAMWKVVGDWPLTASGYTSTAGTTASCAFLRRGKVFTGHVGDSAIMLGRTEDDMMKAICLTVDHKPDSFEEEQRINAAGGMIMKKSGVMRVVWTRPIRGHVGPVRRSTPTESIAFLAVARALGDLWSYNRETKRFVVSPEPDVCVYELDANDKCLVLGSDGLTNVLKPQQIINVISNYEMGGCDQEGRVPNHSRWLLREALRGWGALRADNITVVTVMLDDPTECEQHSEKVVLKRELNMDLEETFTARPSCIVRITPECSEQLDTAPVDLLYNGAVDQNFFNASDVDYKGPGFSRCESSSRPMANRGFPVMSAALSMRRSASTAANLGLLSRTSNSETAAWKPETNNRKSLAFDPSGDRSAVLLISPAKSNSEKLSSSLDECSTSGLETTKESFTEQCSLSSEANGLVSSNERRSMVASDSSFASTTAEGGDTNAVPHVRVDPETGKPVKYYCKKHGLKCSKVKKFNEEYAARRASTARGTPRLGETVDELDVVVNSESHSPPLPPVVDASPQQSTPTFQHRKKVLEEHAYASSTSKPVAVVSPITTTPTSVGEGRKRLVALRRTPLSQRHRSAARRNLLQDEGSENREEAMLAGVKEDEEEGEDACGGVDGELPKAQHSPVGSLTTLRAPDRDEPPAAVALARRSFGGASALSPTLMLEALRTPDRLVQDCVRDPLCRDVTLSSLRIFRARHHAMPSLSAVERLSVDDQPFEFSALRQQQSPQHEPSTVSAVVSSAQKRKSASVGSSSDERLEPPSKRSRFWGFLTNIIGGNK